MANKKNKGTGGREITTEYKLLVVQARLKGATVEDTAKAFGVSGAAVQKWTKAFRERGPDALVSKRGQHRVKMKPKHPAREQVVALKREHDNWGTRRIRDVLVRFSALGVSEQQVRAILHEEGLIESPVVRPEREHPPRRFERAAPNQLWQSDIFTFRLRRAERLYVCVFMDDHSRFVVGHAIAHHQKSVLVMEAFERGIAAYGNPHEVLTDNGRQYTVWRGKTEFEETLARLGIQHIRSRPQHPQTLGKVERFWKTLWDEFLGRTVFAHVADAQHRFEHFISHYNFQRPHQGIDGLVPADRYFGAASAVKKTLAARVAANALELARQGVPQQALYLTGQVGGQPVSLHAEGERVILTGPEGTRQEIDLAAPPDSRGSARVSASVEDAETISDIPMSLPEPVCPAGIVSGELGEPEPAPGTSPLDDGLRRLANVLGAEEGGAP